MFLSTQLIDGYMDINLILYGGSLYLRLLLILEIYTVPVPEGLARAVDGLSFLRFYPCINVTKLEYGYLCLVRAALKSRKHYFSSLRASPAVR